MRSPRKRHFARNPSRILLFKQIARKLNEEENGSATTVSRLGLASGMDACQVQDSSESAGTGIGGLSRLDISMVQMGVADSQTKMERITTMLKKLPDKVLQGLSLDVVTELECRQGSCRHGLKKTSETAQNFDSGSVHNHPPRDAAQNKLAFLSDGDLGYLSHALLLETGCRNPDWETFKTLPKLRDIVDENLEDLCRDVVNELEHRGRRRQDQLELTTAGPPAIAMTEATISVKETLSEAQEKLGSLSSEDLGNLAHSLLFEVGRRNPDWEIFKTPTTPSKSFSFPFHSEETTCEIGQAITFDANVEGPVDELDTEARSLHSSKSGMSTCQSLRIEINQDDVKSPQPSGISPSIENVLFSVAGWDNKHAGPSIQPEEPEVNNSLPPKENDALFATSSIDPETLPHTPLARKHFGMIQDQGTWLLDFPAESQQKDLSNSKEDDAQDVEDSIAITKIIRELSQSGHEHWPPIPGIDQDSNEKRQKCDNVEEHYSGGSEKPPSQRSTSDELTHNSTSPANNSDEISLKIGPEATYGGTELAPKGQEATDKTPELLTHIPMPNFANSLFSLAEIQKVLLTAESLSQETGEGDQEKLQESQGGNIEPFMNDGSKLEFSSSKSDQADRHISVLPDHIQEVEQSHCLDSQEEAKKVKLLFPLPVGPEPGIQDPTVGYSTSASPNNPNYDPTPSPSTPKPTGIPTPTTTPPTETPSPCNQAESSTNNHRDRANRKPFDRTSGFCLDGLVCDKSKFVVACGGFSDVWKGKVKAKMKMKGTGDGSASCSDDTDGAAQVEQDVAIKVLRGFNSVGKSFAQAKVLKRLWREYLAWSSLSHPNIIECLGFTYDFVHESQYQVPALISPWMSNGTVFSYILEHPEKDRMSLIVGITQGLCYLHSRSPPIVHGDIRAGNILVSDEGIPCFTDFGLSRILQDEIGLTTSNDTAGSLRWMAPELFDNDKVSEASDVWAYGMTLLEILTSKRPFSDIPHDPTVLRRVIEGQSPPEPSPQAAPSMTGQLWNICVRCWAFKANERPPVSQIAFELVTEDKYREWQRQIKIRMGHEQK